MQMARASALCLLGVAVICAPAWAQDTQQAPPPAPAQARMMGGQRAGMMGPGCGMARTGRWMGPGGHMLFWRSRHTGGPGEMGSGAGFGFASRVARMVNNANFRQRLGITDAQAAKIRQQTMDFQVSQIRSRADLQIDQLQLRNLLTAPAPDRAAIDQKLDQISAAQLAQRKRGVDYMLSLRDALTPEQRQKLQQMRRGPARRGERGQAAPPASAPPPDQPNP
ncbi:MAG TPA: periplasmic heavy metal sensor [Patescibacteria group bacterium]|nr:periplasmic heavy metal sensor [Patescibacteria group bacterium]